MSLRFANGFKICDAHGADKWLTLLNSFIQMFG
jgi:hypothetical protein